MVDFHFTIKYRPGRENSDADALSRMLLDVESLMRVCSEELPPDTTAATIQAVEVQKEPLATMSFSVMCMSVSVADETNPASVSPIPKDQLRETQKSDPIIRPVLESQVPDRQS